MAQQQLLDGSGYRKFKEVIAAQGGNPQVLDRFELLPNATGCAKSLRRARGYVSAIDAEDIGQASSMIGAGRDTKEDAIDPAVGVILEVKVGQKMDAGWRALPPLLHRRRACGRSRRDWWKTLSKSPASSRRNAN